MATLIIANAVPCWKRKVKLAETVRKAYLIHGNQDRTEHNPVDGLPDP